MLSHKELCVLGSRFVKNNIMFFGGYRFERILVETGFRKENPDVFAINKYGSVLIECKKSRADFLQDSKKPFREHPEQGIGMYRYYLVNPGVAKQEDMPEGWQLLIAVDENTIELPFPYKSLNDAYKFKDRNYAAELEIMWSWEYRKEHNCLPVISNELVKTLRSAEKKALEELNLIGQEAFRRKYYPIGE